MSSDTFTLELPTAQLGAASQFPPRRAVGRTADLGLPVAKPSRWRRPGRRRSTWRDS